MSSCRRKQEQNGVGRIFRHNAVLAQEVGEDRGRNAKDLHIRRSRCINARCGEQRLQGRQSTDVQHSLQAHASVLPERSGRSADRWRSLTSGMTATAYHQSVPVRTDGCGDSFRINLRASMPLTA